MNWYNIGDPVEDFEKIKRLKTKGSSIEAALAGEGVSMLARGP